LFNFFVFLEISSLAGAAPSWPTGWTTVSPSKRASSTRLLSTLGALAVLTAIGILIGQYNALNLATLASRNAVHDARQDRRLVLLAVPLR
jgi:multicomponent Na+:H+ antiporter subunit D